MIYSFLRRSPRRHLRRVEHIFYKYSISHRGIIYHNVGDGAYELTVLNYRATAHEYGQEGTTVFYSFSTVSMLLLRILSFHVVI